jgi:RNAse (barnase) inhibitor barstar
MLQNFNSKNQLAQKNKTNAENELKPNDNGINNVSLPIIILFIDAESRNHQLEKAMKSIAVYLQIILSIS